MTLEGLFWKVNQERKRIRNESLGWIFIGAINLFGVLYFSVLSGNLWELDRNKLFMIISGVLFCYFGLEWLRFSFKLSKRLKDSVSSAASDLLDHYRREYKEGSILFLFVFAFIVFVIIDNWLTWGFDVFWFPFWVAMLCFTIILWRYSKKWTTESKMRKEIEKLMEGYLQGGHLEAKTGNAQQVKD